MITIIARNAVHFAGYLGLCESISDWRRVMKFVNRKHGLALYVQTLPGQKKPSLLIADELGYKKVAAFIKDEDADDFVAHMQKFLEAEVKDEQN